MIPNQTGRTSQLTRDGPSPSDGPFSRPTLQAPREYRRRRMTKAIAGASRAEIMR